MKTADCVPDLLQHITISLGGDYYTASLQRKGLTETTKGAEVISYRSRAKKQQKTKVEVKQIHITIF